MSRPSPAPRGYVAIGEQEEADMSKLYLVEAAELSGVEPNTIRNIARAGKTLPPLAVLDDDGNLGWHGSHNVKAVRKWANVIASAHKRRPTTPTGDSSHAD